MPRGVISTILAMTVAAQTLRAASWTRKSALRRMHLPHGWSLAQQYLITSLVVVLGGVLVTGAWIGHQIQTSVLDRSAALTALYVDSVVTPSVQALAFNDRWLTPTDTAALNRLITTTSLGESVVLFKIWSVDGRVLYSPDQSLVGQQFPLDAGLERARRGEVSADISDLDEPENINERQRFSRLVEVYAPIRQDKDGRVIAINEIYLQPDALEADIRQAQLRSWAVVGGIGLITYLLLAGIVKRGSDTIRQQQSELRRRLDQNLRLHERVLQAAERSTALNEQALRRISADLHDGPGQALALALLRLDALQTPGDHAAAQAQSTADFQTVKTAVRDALADLRAISAGLRLPELEQLSITEAAARTIDDHQRRGHVRVDAQLDNLPAQAPLPVKIALVRTLQEALSNATRHGGGTDIRVRLTSRADALSLTVSDHGPGFDPLVVERSGRLGIAGMRERAELLGGSFAIQSTPGDGACVNASWPLSTRSAA